MLMNLGCTELAMFCGWLKVISHMNQNVWDASAVCVQTGFILSLYFSWCFMRNKYLPAPSSVSRSVLGLLQNSTGQTLFILYT